MWADGALESAFGDGALAAVARADLAEAAAVIAADPAPHGGRTYDLTGTPVTAAQVAGRLGVPHRTIGLGEYRRRLDAMPELLPFQPPMLVSIATGIRHGFLDGTGPDLARHPRPPGARPTGHSRHSRGRRLRRVRTSSPVVAKRYRTRPW
ncbi:hypothetical protein LUW77_01310 [Streptomyces radiopugnans]|nr:hypothetical protein LUW77_01310 [Streptomyces radiopugnans]